jgi:hypothetical protein
MAPTVAVGHHPSDGHAIVTVRGDLDTDTALQLWPYLSYPRRSPLLDSPECVCAGQARFEYPATSVPFRRRFAP